MISKDDVIRIQELQTQLKELSEEQKQRLAPLELRVLLDVLDKPAESFCCSTCISLLTNLLEKAHGTHR